MNIGISVKLVYIFEYHAINKVSIIFDSQGSTMPASSERVIHTSSAELVGLTHY